MKEFTPLEYIKISVANAYGLDRETWQDRLYWFDTIIWEWYVEDRYRDAILGFIKEAKEPILMEKGIRAYLDAIAGIPTGYIMGLDATASNLQLMAVLIGCPTTAKATNLINTGKREDAYEMVARDVGLPRSTCKKPVMTSFFGSKQQPKELFGEGTPELAAFYEALDTHFVGAMEWMEDVQSCWDPKATCYTFHMPDMHTSRIKVMKAVDKVIEIDELDHATFTHRLYENTCKDFGLFLQAHIVHAVDGYIVREMLRMANDQGFDLLTTHDNFWSSPNSMQNVRENYLKILIDLANSNCMQGILREITGNRDLVFTKITKNLGNLMLDAEYALS